MFFTWSAAQMLIYNALVQERMYFLGFFRKFGGKLPPIDQKYSHLINRKTGICLDAQSSEPDLPERGSFA